MRLAQLSDPHVQSPSEHRLFGENTLQCLHNAVRSVNALQPRPDCVVITGDLANDREEASYRLVKTAIDRLEVPFYLAPGNHDAWAPFRRVLLEETPPSTDPICYRFDHSGYGFVVLDSLDEGKGTGWIDDPQLQWLDDILKANPSQDTTILLHHPPVQVGVEWMDALGLQEATRLTAILERHPQVGRVLCGHVHHPFHIQRRGISYLTAPSVSFQLRKCPLKGMSSDDPMRLHRKKAPSFRVVDLDGDGWSTFLQTIDPAQPG